MTLLAPKFFHSDWLNKRHTGEFAAVLSELMGRSVFVTFDVLGSEGAAPRPSAVAAVAADPLASVCPEVRPHWRTLLAQVRERLPRHIFDRWVKLTGASAAGDVITFTVEDRNCALRLETGHTSLFAELLSTLIGRNVTVLFAAPGVV